MDLAVAMTGLTAVHDHWRRVSCRSRDIPYNLQKEWALYTRACKEASAAEGACLSVPAELFSAVSLEPVFAVSQDEVMVKETLKKTGSGNGVVKQTTGGCLWVFFHKQFCCFSRLFLVMAAVKKT